MHGNWAFRRKDRSLKQATLTSNKVLHGIKIPINSIQNCFFTFELRNYPVALVPKFAQFLRMHELFESSVPVTKFLDWTQKLEWFLILLQHYFLVPLIKLVILLQCQRNQREETQQLMVLILSSLMIRLSSLSVLVTLVIHIRVYNSDIGYNGIHL